MKAGINADGTKIIIFSHGPTLEDDIALLKKAAQGTYPIQPSPAPEADPLVNKPILVGAVLSITERTIIPETAALPQTGLEPAQDTAPEANIVEEGTWVYEWELVSLTLEEYRDKAKIERQKAVDNIKVTVNGKVFDGDEISQGRMARAIIGLQAVGQATITWVLADNTPTEATLAELTEALCLAGQAQADVWVI